MHRPLMFVAGLISALTLAACATSSPAYGPASGAGVGGYSETQIEASRYFVTYRAPSGADAALLQDFALLRAAELTLANGREWFWVDRRTLDEGSSASGPSVGVGVGAGSWGRRSGGSVGVGVTFPIGGGAQRARAVTLEVRFGEGAKPDSAEAYDARSVATNIRAQRAQPR